MFIRYLYLLIAPLFLFNQENKPNEIENSLYFPPLDSEEWVSINPSKLDWNTTELSNFEKFLEKNDSKACIILKNGKIAFEWYARDFQRTENWYWASAGKTLTATTLGIAQQNGFLNIHESSATYLGEGWTRAKPSQEREITIEHQLSMTTGLKNTFFSCTKPICLPILTAPKSRWAYHNGPYTLLQSVISNAVDEPFENYYNKHIRDKIGMNGFWVKRGNNNIYMSTARSMARFGLLILNQGAWDSHKIINSSYVNKMTTPSQNINKSYGFLWWLNGKKSFMLPASQKVYSGSLIPNAPKDLIAGLGKNDQKLYVIPSQNMVVIRMGDKAKKGSLAKSSFDNELWALINNIID